MTWRAPLTDAYLAEVHSAIERILLLVQRGLAVGARGAQLHRQPPPPPLPSQSLGPRGVGVSAAALAPAPHRERRERHHEGGERTEVRCEMESGKKCKRGTASAVPTFLLKRDPCRDHQGGLEQSIVSTTPRLRCRWSLGSGVDVARRT